MEQLHRQQLQFTQCGVNQHVVSVAVHEEEEVAASDNGASPTEKDEQEKQDQKQSESASTSAKTTTKKSKYLTASAGIRSLQVPGRDVGDPGSCFLDPLNERFSQAFQFLLEDVEEELEMDIDMTRILEAADSESADSHSDSDLDSDSKKKNTEDNKNMDGADWDDDDEWSTNSVSAARALYENTESTRLPIDLHLDEDTGGFFATSSFSSSSFSSRKRVSERSLSRGDGKNQNQNQKTVEGNAKQMKTDVQGNEEFDAQDDEFLEEGGAPGDDEFLELSSSASSSNGMSLSGGTADVDSVLGGPGPSSLNSNPNNLNNLKGPRGRQRSDSLDTFESSLGPSVSELGDADAELQVLSEGKIHLPRNQGKFP